MRLAAPRAVRIALALVISWPLVAVAGPAVAHTPSNCNYGGGGTNCLIYNKWANNKYLVWAFHTSVGVGSWIEYFTKDASDRWFNARLDDEPGTPLDYFESTRKAYLPFEACTVGDWGYDIGIASASLDAAFGTGAAGIALQCPQANNIHVPTTSSIIIDTNGGGAPGGWYLGTGQPPVGDLRRDLWSVVVHEYGHAVGYQPHQPENEVGTCVESGTDDHDWAGRHTMCQFIYLDTNRQRTLASHDLTHFRDEY